MTPRDAEFFAKIYELVDKIEKTTEEYGMRDRVMAAIVFGLFDEDAHLMDSDEAEMTSLYSFYIEDDREIETIQSLMLNLYDSHKKKDNGFGDLLDGFGDISLN